MAIGVNIMIICYQIACTKLFTNTCGYTIIYSTIMFILYLLSSRLALQGVINSAHAVQIKLESEHILEKAFEKHPVSKFY